MKKYITTGMKIKALVLLTVLVTEIIFPLGAYALTGGPSQPEVQSFEPVGTSEMVDVFSGDFNYNIPLLDVNGYPINIAYHAGVSMDQEASWVGLGWNINPGTINRDMRGLPDDMNGEDVTKEVNLQDNWTLDLKASAAKDIETFGKVWKDPDAENGAKILGQDSIVGSANIGLNLGLRYNRYKGMGYSMGASANLRQLGDAQESGLNEGLSMQYSEDGGMEVSPSISMVSQVNDPDNGSKFTVGTSVNSRAGLRGLNLDASVTKNKVGTSGNINYTGATPTYTPNISTPMAYFSTNFSFKSGQELFGTTLSGDIQGAWSNQYIPGGKKSQTKKGYGYLYEHEANTDGKPSNRDYLLDFNRENDGPLMRNTPFLPWANHTYDMYNVSAQGVGGAYRLQRNDLAVVHDDYRDSKTNGGRLGFDFGASGLLKVGTSLGYTYNRSSSGYWGEDQENNLANRVGFVKDAGEATYEPVYFKDVNELTPQNEAYLNLIEGTHLVAPQRSGYGLSPILKTNNPSNTNKSLSAQKASNTSTERVTRNKLFTYRKASESDFCLDQKIKSYPMNGQTFLGGKLQPDSEESRISGSRLADHISEVEILNSDGSRHVFGIPAYNHHQVEKSFRVDADDADLSTGLVGYTRNIDNVLFEPNQNTKNAIDEYYKATKTPAYAHSYLITGVLSPDYLDLTGDGITDDDLGSAVKFNYTKVHDNFGWRAPYQTDKAKHARGNISDEFDDIGNYIYGQKEVWHVHSIEGKTHIALFKVSDRDDALGVANENGDKDVNKRMVKLDRIELYSKRELKEFGEDAVPIKTVHFTYSYDLCKGVGNQVSPSTQGKLTLDKVYFTYGASEKGTQNAYKFHYNDNGATYNLMAYDRWGTYAPPRTLSSETTNAEYPYTDQNPSNADEYAGLWNLNKIELPSGGVINVAYEADDYAYVQDKRAMRMMKIDGFGRWSDDESYIVERDKLYEKTNARDHNQTDIIIFDLEEALPVSDVGKRILIDEYLSDIESIQVTAHIDIHDGNYEYIKTYVSPNKDPFQGQAEIKCGIMPDGLRGYVEIIKEGIRNPANTGSNSTVNPIAMAGWEYTRMNLNHLINPSSDRKRNDDGAILNVANGLLGFFNEIGTFALGPNRILMERGFCQEVNLDKSWIRLNDPNKIKRGGGHRVKQITMNDNWASINSQDADAEDSEYGQVYDYTMEEESSSQGMRVISSGVASYEPFIGRDENPFVQGLSYSQDRKGIPDDRYTFEKPVGESFFPGPSVGYQKITVRSMSHEGQSKQHRTGYQVSEFYTYKDFPVEVTPSDIDHKFSDEGLGLGLAGITNKVEATAVQGYLISLNDMHGKPKANWSYDENDNLLSGVEYTYQTDADGGLNNEVMAIDRFGDIASKTFGVNVDFTMDSRFMKDQSFSADADLNLDAFTLFIPVVVGMVWPQAGLNTSLVRTSTVIKVVQRKGLLKQTIAYKEGSKIATDNLLYDGATGSVLLTSVDNEFGNKVYSFNYPAHWAYDDGMGQAFVNWGLEVQGLSMNGGVLVSTNVNNDLDKMLFPGDICRLNRPGKYENMKVWVNKTTSDDLVLIDETGEVIYDAIDASRDAATSLRVLRSGRKNMAGVSIGSVTCLENPIKDQSGNLSLEFSDVLATSAVEYKDEWRTDLSLFARYDCDTVGTAKLIDHLNRLDTLISDSFFKQAVPQSWYDLDTCITCAEGYTFNDSTGYCEQFDTLSITSFGRFDTIRQGDQNGAFSLDGTTIYPNIDSWNPLVLEPSHSIYSSSSSMTGVWQRTGGYDGRLNDVGIWSDSLTTQAWSGITECITIPTTKEYSIGIAADNFFRFKINGKTILETDETQHDFNYFRKWHVFPITLEAGTAVIEIEGRNNNADYDPIDNPATFGAEIYDLTRSELLALTNKSQLVGKVLFSTKDRVGSYFQISSDPTLGYGCPDGYAVNLCDPQSPKCTFVDRVYRGFCTPCPLILETGGYPTADILEIIDNSPIDFQTAALTARVKNEFNEIDTIDLTLYSECDTLYNCETICKIEEHARTINPFVTGLRGNWRPFKSWTYVEDRQYDSTRVNPEEDGTFATYANFWEDDNVNGSFVPTYTIDKWVWTSEVTEYSPFGMELENKDPLGRYSAALYGYANTLPTAVASNTRHRELWYEGFEEYTYLKTLNNTFLCPQWGNPYQKDGEVYAMVENDTNLDDSISHSGHVSLRLDAGDSLVQEIALSVPFVPYSSTVLNGQYITDQDDQILPFRPTEGSYVVGLWVHEDMAPTDTLFTDTYIEFAYEDGQGQVTTEQVRPSGVIIEGWQRVETVINIPSSAEKLTITYKSDSGTSWFDDFRIFPYHGSMKSYAYDFRTLRLMAELDENNYATFYEYDLEGNLVRIKKETERGIKTLQESRQHQKAN